MNKNQVNGVAKEISGKIQENIGKMIDSDEQKIKGISKQIIGKTEKSVGDAKEVLKEKIDKI